MEGTEVLRERNNKKKISMACSYIIEVVELTNIEIIIIINKNNERT